MSSFLHASQHASMDGTSNMTSSLLPEYVPVRERPGGRYAPAAHPALGGSRVWFLAAAGTPGQVGGARPGHQRGIGLQDLPELPDSGSTPDRIHAGKAARHTPASETEPHAVYWEQPRLNRPAGLPFPTS